MTSQNDDFQFPRIFSIESEASQELQSSIQPVQNDLFACFEALTGWKLEFTEGRASYTRRQQPGMSHSPATGTISISDMSENLGPAERPLSRVYSDALAEQIDQVVSDLQRTRLELFSSQAAMATQIPVVIPPAESFRLAELFSQLLDTAKTVVGGKAAAMYLIDERDEFLCLRSSVGLDRKLDLNDRRLMSNSVADVEAMSGHAIVVTDRQQAEIWDTPHACESAVCIPIASSTTILGTLWVYGETERDFSDEQVNMLEIIAGRLASELEREAIIATHSNQTEVMGAIRNIENNEVAEASTKNEIAIDANDNPIESFLTKKGTKQLVNPPFEGWAAAGETGVSKNNFVEWWVTGDEQIVMVCGDVAGNHAEGSDEGAAAMGLIATRIFLDSNACWISPEQVVCEVSEILPNLAPNCRLRKLTCVMIDPLTGDIRIADETFGRDDQDGGCGVLVHELASNQVCESSALPVFMRTGDTIVLAPNVPDSFELTSEKSIQELAGELGDGTPKIVLQRV